MASWENEFFRGYPAQEVKQEYRKLLSVNLSDAESERLIIEHFTKRITPDSREEAKMWFSLALIQWQLGRLSEAVRDRAFHFLTYPVDWVSAESLGLLKSTLCAAMPEKKKSDFHPMSGAALIPLAVCWLIVLCPINNWWTKRFGANISCCALLKSTDFR